MFIAQKSTKLPASVSTILLTALPPPPPTPTTLMQQGAVMSGAPSAVKSCGLPGAAAPSSVENSSKVAASSGSVRNCVPSKRPRKNCVGLTGARRGASAAALAARTISRGMGTAREARARAQRSKGVAEALSEPRNAALSCLPDARGVFLA